MSIIVKMVKKMRDENPVLVFMLAAAKRKLGVWFSWCDRMNILI